MTHFRDLTPYSYFELEPGTVNVGWLARWHPFPLGATSEEFRRRLIVFCENPPGRYATRGFHMCDFCGRAGSSSEMRVIGKDRAYAAPVLIAHYVTAHHYKPPQEFIDAVLTSPLPDSPEMKERFGEPRHHELTLPDYYIDQGQERERKPWWRFW